MSVPFEGLIPATDQDAIAGVPARYVAAPATTEEAAAIVRAAAEKNLAIVVRGAGTKQDWAAPPRKLDLIIDTGRLTGVVDHAAGDLITVVRAGTPLSELGEKLAPAGQQLALDAPILSSTVGGTVAVNMSGPRRMLYGTVRDLLIGVTMVRGDGVVAHAGGKVVKNVAGYDLGKLITGSYGTLGLVTECVFRLHPLPAAHAYVSRRVAGVAEAGRIVAAVLGAQVVPSALEVSTAPDGGIEVCVLVEGVPEGVRGRVETTRFLFGGDAAVSDTAPDWWATYPWGPGGVGFKLTAALSAVPGLLAAGLAARERHGVPLAVRGSAGTGVLYAGLPGTTSPDVVAAVLADLRAAAGRAGGHAVVLTAPSAVRPQLDLWGPVEGLHLMRRVKEQFDPDARFAPGRFVGGI
ncbi:FAD-binding oxidoreductase [Planosporangium flavigriseum]|uniref:Glycolate oxidase n=1 Tax=Planosporangium flavigriseum TaxID=373681 RepID=A0A8J3PJX6_9ACTN|nr:FAD-binding oxidoreductase [Planosporangium flavigriseum]NJC64987.1 FAD-binding oxidoreductase [Planosporangium flavigriseum]GIG71599.1 glycolate oxidase [Planosporangium flavigriseum]